MLLILRNAQFRILWISSLFNDLGMIMYMMVQGWLALVVTDSPFWVGATAGANGLGLMSFSIFGGVLVDRLDRRKLIMFSRFIQGVFALVLASLIFTDNIQIWHILTMGFIEGMVVAVKIPARMAITLDVVGKPNLMSATAAVFAGMTIMGIVAPLLGGFIVSTFDIAWAYVLIGISYFAATLVILNMRSTPRLETRTNSPWYDMKQGVRYVFTTPRVRGLILMTLITEAFGWSHESMLPVIARDELGVGAAGLGYLIAAGSAGATITNLVLANIGDVKQKGRVLVFGFGGFGLFLILFSASQWLLVSMILLAMAYASVVAYEVSINTILQTIVPNEMRGRVLSFQTFTWGLTGFSGFHVGAIATVLGAPLAIGVGGGVVVLNALRVFKSTLRLQTQQEEVAAGD